MAELIINARQDLRLVQSAVSARASAEGSEWPLDETLSVLIDFYSAQWEHLEELSGEDRWLRSLPSEPRAEREAELHALLELLLQAKPPAEVADSLRTNLRQTEELAATYEAQAAEGSLDKPLLFRLRERQEGLETAKAVFLEIEHHLYGRVPPIPAGIEGQFDVSTHKKAE